MDVKRARYILDTYYEGWRDNPQRVTKYNKYYSGETLILLELLRAEVLDIENGIVNSYEYTSKSELGKMSHLNSYAVTEIIKRGGNRIRSTTKKGGRIVYNIEDFRKYIERGDMSRQ